MTEYLSDQEIVSYARKYGVSIVQVNGDTWSWDYPGAGGGCGLPSEVDAAVDALDTISGHK